jgi:pyruvate kinase
MAKTKIICTYGPSMAAEKIVRKMMLAGLDVIRFNFSHSSPEAVKPRLELIRNINRKTRRHIRLLGDLEGHRIRIGALDQPVELKKREYLWLTAQNTGAQQNRIPFDYQGPLEPIKAGQHVFIDDGNIVLQVTGRDQNSLKTRVIVGGLLKPHKGVNIPDAKLEFVRMEQKDIEDILFCRDQAFDFIAQSFVRSRQDILDVREKLGPGARCRIIAKIETREGIKNIDSIIEVSDGIMIARGDMGVSIPVYEIPVVQKMIIRKCNRAGKFVITATQMLESMTENPRPTRAEVTDVANAIIDGSDYVMLSAESAVGKYPVETVTLMNQIIRYTEGYLKNSERRNIRKAPKQ